eukprot:2181612-Amphidinium_carterae.1
MEVRSKGHGCRRCQWRGRWRNPPGCIAEMFPNCARRLKRRLHGELVHEVGWLETVILHKFEPSRHRPIQ